MHKEVITINEASKRLVSLGCTIERLPTRLRVYKVAGGYSMLKVTDGFVSSYAVKRLETRIALEGVGVS